MGLSLSEQLMYNVLHITKLDANENPVAYATGFMFCFFENTDHQVNCLVTNRHVLSNCSKIEISLTRKRADGTPDIGNIFQIRINIASAIYHPNSNIDLALLPLAPAIRELQHIGEDPYYTYLTVGNIPTPAEWSNFTAIEEVIMPTHPYGLRDMTKSQPIFRRGITATHPALDFKGTPEFLVDMPCFEGCSGSPIVICNEGIHIDKRHNRIGAGNKIYLLGVQYSVPRGLYEGQLKTITSEVQSQIPVMPLYLSLGNIIRSTELLTFESILLAKINSQATAAQ